jgi:hypothetical protein
VIIPSTIIRHIMAISERTSTGLRLKQVCDRVWSKDQ